MRCIAPEETFWGGLRLHTAGCQNYGPFWGTLNIRGRIIIGTQKGTIILTTTHTVGGGVWVQGYVCFYLGYAIPLGYNKEP